MPIIPNNRTIPYNRHVKTHCRQKMSSLNVELYGILLGKLTPEEREFSFEVEPGVFEHYPADSTIMSLAVPLSSRYTAPQRKKYLNFFAELLPEGRNLRWLCEYMPPENRNTLGVLRKHGRDSAGALTIYDPDDPGTSTPATIERVDGQQVRYLLEHMPQEPLANSPVSGRIVLGGMQGKIVLARENDEWYRTHYGYPSTHILKPAVHELPTLIYDEAFCMQLAQKVGLTSKAVWIEEFDGADALVIERFDRDNAYSGGRIHQEDFNQALGARGDQKYQDAGGKVSAKRIALTLERFAGKEEVAAFASQMLFAIAIGNLDLHAKNISVFHFPDGTVKLTPTYDQVPLRHQPTDERMALAVGGEYVHANLNMQRIIAELLSWKSDSFPDERAAETFVKNCLGSYLEAMEDVPLHNKAYPMLREMITLFITRLLCGKSIGKEIGK